MKNINIILSLLVFCVTAFLITQTLDFDANTGDKAFDKRLNEINKEAIKNIDVFSLNISKKYVVDKNEIDQLVATLEPVEILLLLEVSKFKNASFICVLNIYNQKNFDNWEIALKHFGINNNSNLFKRFVASFSPQKVNSLSKR